MKPSVRTMSLMGLMMAGLTAIEAIGTNLLPITTKHFTSNLVFIGSLVALNRICGFLVQPYVAWVSDGHCSRYGRRRPFLLAAWSVALICMGLLGALPFIVPADYQHTTGILVAIWGIVLLLQAASDMASGSASPMYGDVFPSQSLGRATGIRKLVANVAMLGMVTVAVPLADRNEFLPYVGAMVLILVSLLVTGFGIKETISVPLPRVGRYHPLRPLGGLRDPRTRNVAIIASAVVVTIALTEMFHGLFVTETLGLSKTALGWASAAGVFVTIVCPVPVGLATDRRGPQTVLIFGFAVMTLVELALIFCVRGVVSLSLALVLFNIARMLIYIPITALMFQNVTAERRGAVFATVQMTRAMAAGLLTVGASYFADLFASYRVCYWAAAGVSLIGLLATRRLRHSGPSQTGATAGREPLAPGGREPRKVLRAAER